MRVEKDVGPTEFALMRRAELLGEGVYCSLKDRQLRITGKDDGWAATSALSLMYHRGLLTSEQYRAGLTYARLRLVLFGPAAARQSALAKVIADNLIFLAAEQAKSKRVEELTDEERGERLDAMRAMFYRGDDALRKILYALRVREFVRKVCIDDVMLDPKRPRQLDRLRDGLNRLYAVWEREIGE